MYVGMYVYFDSIVHYTSYVNNVRQIKQSQIHPEPRPTPESAHASASHAQDCPDRKLERPILPWSSGISLCLLQEISFLWPWSGVMVLMLWHHMHKTVLTGSWRIFLFSRVVISICISFQEMLSLRSWPGVMALMLRHHTHKTVLAGSWRKIY